MKRCWRHCKPQPQKGTAAAVPFVLFVPDFHAAAAPQNRVDSADGPIFPVHPDCCCRPDRHPRPGRHDFARPDRNDD
ncbi:hypothetical protein CBM2621_A160098 [Cupriavidus taiwanensis]|nr:hypothetical protein CBM2621_A160098 [Cupriavidus taiwanensis]